MLNRKKVVWLRTVVLLAVVALLIALFFAASAIANSRQMHYMKTPELTGQTEYRVETKIDAADKSRFTALDPVEDPDCEKAAENDYLILYTNKEYKGIKLYEKSTGKVWSSYVDDEALLAKEDSEIYKKAMNSLFSFKYMELKASVASSIVNSGYSADYITGTDEDGNTVTRVTAEKIFGGVRWTFDIHELSITVAIDMLLDGDALVVKVPDDKIIERQDNLEAISNSKDTMEEMIEEIRSICEKVKSAAENNRDFSDSAKKAVQTNLEKAIKTLTDIKTTAGTSKFNPNDIEVLTTRVKNTMKTVKNLPEQQEALQKVLDMTDELYQSALMISEGIPHGLISLTVMPYFGAQGKETDGYVFYPDGSGAISYFGTQHPSTSGSFSGDVYGSHGNIADTSANDKEASVWSVDMPVYGVKAGNSAFVAILTLGDTDANISYVPISDIRPVAAVNGTYYMRKSTTMVNANGGHTILYDTHRTAQDWETRYCFLGEADADYSGMARKYRAYLEDTGKLTRSPLMDSETIPLALEFFMGTNSGQKTLFANYITMTRYQDILDMMQRLEQDGVGKVLVNVWGWESDYLDTSMPDPVPAGAPGGQSGLKKLASFMKGKDWLLSLERSNTWIDKSEMSSSQKTIASVKAKSQMIRDWLGMCAMNPVYTYNTFLENVLPRYEKFGLNAAQLTEINTLFYDYNENAPLDRLDTAHVFSSLVQTVREKLGYYVSSQPPQFMMSATDWMIYVEEDDSNFMYADTDVPFYQIVVHGSAVYSGNAYNYMYDTSQQSLKAIEYGYVPFYMLTKEPPYELRMSMLKNNFFSTVLDDWYDRIVQTYQQYEKDFADIWNVQITSHQRLSDKVGCTTYANGVKVYVNYDKAAVTINGVTIAAEGYVVVR